MNYNRAIENADIRKIDKLNTLTDVNSFWDDVAKFTKNIHSDHSLGRWECLAEYRFSELEGASYVH